MEPVLILGGGLAGLSAAYFSEKPWRLIERSDRVGGLVKTDRLDGFLFDATGHWLHLRDKDIRERVEKTWLPGELVCIQRRAAIYSRGVFTRFPYQVNTHGLPADVVAENLIGFVEAQLGPKGRALREREPRNFHEFILRYLGEGFAKNFMVPYNRKLWTVEPEELSAAWCGRFVPKPSLEEVVRGALGLGSDALGYNASFLYPREGGIERWAQAMAASLRGGDVELNVEPTSIDWKARRASLSDGRVLGYSHLVSTVSLPGLVAALEKGASGAPPEVVGAAGRLRATTVTYVRVGARGPNRQPWHWIYLPEDRFHAYRSGAPSAVYPGLGPSGHASFYVEYSHQGSLTPEEGERYAVEDLVASQMIHGAQDVLFASAKEIPHAYVLYDEAYGPAKERIVRFLEHAGIEIAGRYGSWEYSSMEDAVLAGRAAARRVNGR